MLAIQIATWAQFYASLFNIDININIYLSFYWKGKGKTNIGMILRVISQVSAITNEIGQGMLDTHHRMSETVVDRNYVFHENIVYILQEYS